MQATFLFLFQLKSTDSSQTMAGKPPEEGYISVVDEEPEIFELLKWDAPQTQKHHQNPHPDHRGLEKGVYTQLKDKSEQMNQQKAPEELMVQEKRSKPAETDPFDLPDPTFIERYRLSKDLARGLIEELKPVMPESTKSIEFSVESKVMAALAFFATGKYQKSIHGKTDPNITQYFVLSAVTQVTEALNNPALVKKYIHFPHLRVERDNLKARFYMKYGVPNVVGCIECTHVPIARPDVDQKSHFNKSYHSKKAQIICDSDLNIISVDAIPGGMHSHNTILNQHAVKNDLESLNNSGEQCWLIGGPHYSQKPYIMTPIPKITKKSPVSPEKYYSTIHTQAHSAIIEAIKQLKSRWKCLQATCNKQYDPNTVSNMIVACCMLHNLCNRRGLPVAPLTQTEERLEAMKQKVANSPVSRKQVEDPKGVQARQLLVDHLWNERKVTPDCGKKRKKPVEERPPPPPPPHMLPPQPPAHAQHAPLMHDQQLQHDDANKRPRILMNTPSYGLGLTSGWGHFPPH
ncbi:putative nuclease HARBI1 [Cydia pomonella]|uniref:putative nuclease HARBI1 n=1 Tax=Cydia pomonella TaxID=82600 RepID=UPI002ADD7087|nr:putative nuclease HARBI1 [Cydia pomonella]